MKWMQHVKRMINVIADMEIVVIVIVNFFDVFVPIFMKTLEWGDTPVFSTIIYGYKCRLLAIITEDKWLSFPCFAKLFNPLTNLIPNPLKECPLLFFRSRCFCRIIESPMSTFNMGRCHWTFVGSIPA